MADHSMALLDSSARDIATRFIATETDQQRLPGRETVKRQTSSDECHGADLTGDIQKLICRFRRSHFIGHD